VHASASRHAVCLRGQHGNGSAARLGAQQVSTPRPWQVTANRMLVHDGPRNEEYVKRVAIIATLSTLLMAILAPTTLAADTTIVNFANAPSGTHFTTGSSTPVCTVTDTGTSVTVSCTGTEVAGVGNTNATVALTVTASATGVCHNPGNFKVVTPFTRTVSETTTATVVSTKNGRLTIPAQSDTITAADALAGFTCPNPNWTPEITDISLTSFTYTVTFAGFANPFIFIDP
jgi:hypothetical protein